MCTRKRPRSATSTNREITWRSTAVKSTVVGLQTDLAGLELGDAEQVVGEPAEVLGLGAQLVEALLARLLGAGGRHRPASAPATP